MPNYAISNNILSLTHATLHYFNTILAVSDMDVHIRLSRSRVRGFGPSFISQDLAFVNSLSNIHFIELEQQNDKPFTTFTKHGVVLTADSPHTSLDVITSKDLFVNFLQILNGTTNANMIRTIFGNLLSMDITGKTVTDNGSILVFSKTEDPQDAPKVWSRRFGGGSSLMYTFTTNFSNYITSTSDVDNVFMQLLIGTFGNRISNITPSTLTVFDTLISNYNEITVLHSTPDDIKANYFFIDLTADNAILDKSSPDSVSYQILRYHSDEYLAFAALPIDFLRALGIPFYKCSLSGYHISDSLSSSLFFYANANRFPPNTWELVFFAQGLTNSLLTCIVCGTRSLLLRSDDKPHVCEECSSLLTEYSVDPSKLNIVNIESYNFEPDDVSLLHKTSDINTLHLGVELEVDRGGESNLNATIATNILSKGNNVWVTHDGSLDNGFEIVTFPATLEMHMDKNMFNYTKMFDFLISKGYKSHDAGTCGLHVHIDRSFFGSSKGDKLYGGAKMAYIMEHLWDDFVLFSRRRYNALEHWAKKKNLSSEVWSDSTLGNIIEHFNDNYGYDKYLAINTLHSHTFELRIFRGTLNATTYLATLQFVDNFARIARATPFDNLPLITFEDIINYNHYDELSLYWAKRKGTTTTDTTTTNTVSTLTFAV